ncbi:hypothetical protein [Histidinibacterium lentulum]|uniref:Uncharacterized protein n=1 Tax=Histidinibacterium lentulum TaxID=2480588 RepID=A0A3N2QSC8_9RHOB|nr:hypothetical protein [Histidinibacterium lentulum]ROT98070.1 hypothetical protein EAT49_17525 [Histidinibacterium lentulum]
MNIYSILMEWEFQYRDAGQYGWAGWAEDRTDAELQCRKDMARAEPELFAEDPPEQVGGEVLDIVEGALVWAAPDVADKLEELVARKAGATHDELVVLLELLRPRDALSFP